MSEPGEIVQSLRRRLPVPPLLYWSIATMVLLSDAASAGFPGEMPWEELCESCEFVGVVEVQTAGVMVAGWRVVEVWKGRPRVGDTFRGRLPCSNPGAIPRVMHGERAVVAAVRPLPPFPPLSALCRSSPLWWRFVPCEWSFEFAYLPLDEREFNSASFLCPPCGDFAEFRRQALAYLRAPAKERSLLLAKARFQMRLQRRVDIGCFGYVCPRFELPAAARQALLAPDKNIFRQEAQKLLGPGDVKSLVEPPADVRGMVERTVLESYLIDAGEEADTAGPALLLRMLRGPNPWDVFVRLCPRNPSLAAKTLTEAGGLGRAMVNSRRDREIASYFCWRCPRERRKCFRSLLASESEDVRATAAVYLAIENEQEGIPILQGVAKYKGPAGSWAALALARRGDKQFLRRALDVFSVPQGESYAHELQCRVRVLLSNVAVQSGLEQPPGIRDGPTWDKENQELGRRLADWWEEHKGRAVLKDPWLAQLLEQKID